jgi:copper(I)-binding protein
MFTHLRAAIMAALLIAAPAAAAHDYRLGDLSIVHPWAPPTPGLARAASAYLQITNNGRNADRLLSAASSRAQTVELHTHVMDGNIARMRRVETIDVAPGATVTFQPGGLHVMMMGLQSPLAEGERVKLTLTFEKAGQIEVDILVERQPRSSPPAGRHGH